MLHPSSRPSSPASNDLVLAAPTSHRFFRQTRLKKEQDEELKKKQKAEAHLYTVIKVVREEDLSEQIGRDIYFDLVDPDKVHSFRIKKQVSFKSFKVEVAKEFGIPVQFQRFWLFSRRQNRTFRPHMLLGTPEETLSVEQLWEVSFKVHDTEIWLFLEVELGDSGPVFPPDRTKEDILLFFKLFDPVKEELRYVGRLYVRSLGKPADIRMKLNEMAGFSPNEDLELYEEIKFVPTVMCEQIDMRLSFISSQLEDGDIICYQKCRRGNADQCRYPDISSCLEYLHYRRIRLKKEQEAEQKKKEKAEAHLYTVIKVIREEDIAEQIGRDIYFDLVDHDKVPSFRIEKQVSFLSFKEAVAKEFDIPVQFQRFWIYSKRQNCTFRPHMPLGTPEETQSVGQLLEVSNIGHNAELRVFLEVELGDSGPVLPPDRTKGDILLFFKLFDPVKEELRYVGRIYVRALSKPAEILTKLNEMAGFLPNEDLELYLEICFEPTVMCRHIDMRLTFISNKLEDGDIICYQKCQRDKAHQCRYLHIPSFLEYVHNRQIRLKNEQEQEQKKKEKAEADLYTVIKVAREEDMAEQIGRDFYFDLVDHDKVHSFRIEKHASFKSFKEAVAQEFGIPVQFQRFWLWALRQNQTFRPHRPLSTPEETKSVGQIREVSNKGHNAELRLFLEVQQGDSGPVLPPDKTKEDLLLFFKLFDPVKEELRYVGRLYVRALGKPADILTKLNEMAGFSPYEDLELYEEIKYQPTVMCEHIDIRLSFISSQIEDGDIICYQKCQRDNANHCRYPDIPSFLVYVNN